jgi:hypothetical protein
MTNPLFHLEAQRLQSNFRHLRSDPKDIRRGLLIAVWLGFILWWDILRHVQAKPAAFLEHWHWLRYAFPVAFASGAALVGSYGRASRWLSRWGMGSWSVLPVEPRAISEWLLSSMLMMDSAWFGVAALLSIGLSYVSGLSWLQEFPLLLLAALLLIAGASVVKVFATLILRLGGAHVLLWPNWVSRAMGSLLTIILLQPLSAVWLLAEYERQSGNISITVAALLALAVSVFVLALLARLLLVHQWGAVAASFELQQTQKHAGESVPLANFFANRMRSPVAQWVTLYNLRSGIELQRWGRPVGVGGRRLYMIIPMFLAVLFLLFVVSMASVQEHSPRIAALGSAAWTSMFMLMLLPPVLPVYRVLRILPVTFGGWIRAIAAFPLLAAGMLILICGVIIGIADPANAYQSVVNLLGTFLSIGLLPALVRSSYPDAKQGADFVAIIVIGVCGLLFYYVSWIAAVALALAANVYFYRKASHEWRCREEGLSV